MYIFNLSVPTVRWEDGKENPWKYPHGPDSLVHIGVRKNKGKHQITQEAKNDTLGDL